MTSVLIVLYIVILSLPIIKRKSDWFAPPILMTITMAFYTVPDLMEILFGGYKQYVQSLPFRIYKDSEWLVERFMIYQILFVGVYYITYYYIANKKTLKHNVLQNITETPNVTRLLGVALLLLCGFSIYDYIQSYGGISSLFMLFTNRKQLAEEQSLYHRLLPTLMTFATIFCMRYILSAKKKSIVLFSLLIIIGFFCYTSGGGRSQFVVFILTILCCYNYWKKKINLLSPKFYVLYGLLAVFIISFQLLRFKDTQDLSFHTIFSNKESLFDSMTYVSTQLLIENYFDRFDFWFGEVFYAVFFIFIPRSIYPLKPAIDEGVYIYNMKFGYPDVLSSNLFVSSWPPFTMGEGYANFGVIGVILFAFILASMHSYVYRMLKSSKSTLFILPIYIFIVLKFQITVFYIANFLYLAIETLLFYKLYSFCTSLKR